MFQLARLRSSSRAHVEPGAGESVDSSSPFCEVGACSDDRTWRNLGSRRERKDVRDGRTPRRDGCPPLVARRSYLSPK